MSPAACMTRSEPCLRGRAPVARNQRGDLWFAWPPGRLPDLCSCLFFGWLGVSACFSGVARVFVGFSTAWVRQVASSQIEFQGHVEDPEASPPSMVVCANTVSGHALAKLSGSGQP